jgi:uncharacterized protein YqjF (DUF2071 family)
VGEDADDPARRPNHLCQRAALAEEGLRTRLTIEVGAAVDPTPLEIWLTARWGAHTRKAGRTWWVPNEHGPFPLHAAEVVDLDDDLVPASGARPTGERLRALFSPGVRARFGRPAHVSNG